MIDREKLLRIFKKTEHLFSLPENDIPHEDKCWYLDQIRDLIRTAPDPDDVKRLVEAARVARAACFFYRANDEVGMIDAAIRPWEGEAPESVTKQDRPDEGEKT